MPRVSPRDAAASKNMLSVVYLVIPAGIGKKKVGLLCEMLTKATLPTLNISLIGSSYAEILIDG